MRTLHLSVGRYAVFPLPVIDPGYEMSQGDSPAPPKAPGLRVVPLAGMTERGPRLGLMGRF